MWTPELTYKRAFWLIFILLILLLIGQVRGCGENSFQFAKQIIDDSLSVFDEPGQVASGPGIKVYYSIQYLAIALNNNNR